MHKKSGKFGKKWTNIFNKSFHGNQNMNYSF